MSLNERIEEFLREKGALKVGFATRDTLEGGPPSVDLEYCLEGARSAVSFALPLNRDHIRAFLSKKDRESHEADNLMTNIKATQVSWELAGMLKEEGHESKGTLSNLKYRKEYPDWVISMHPDISHRYIAVSSGVGSFGWSGNVGMKGYGTAIILGTTITQAELEPTEPIPEEESFCDKCKLCASACALEMMEKDKDISVDIGGFGFTHCARRSYLLCHICCGGFSGLHKSGKWSSWSPGRFEIPEGEDNLFKLLGKLTELYKQRPPMPGGYQHTALKGARQYLTCGNCQISCWGDKKETAKNVKLLKSSGCVLQRKDGTLYALPPDEAAIVFEEMDPDHKKLYF